MTDAADEDDAVVVAALPALVPALVRVLLSGGPDAAHAALGALASAAATGGPAFAPHAPSALPPISRFMQCGPDAGEKALSLRARATEAAGIVAATLGRDGAAPLLQEMVPVMLAGLAIDDSELREYTHGALANVATLVGPGVAPLLPQIVPAALASLDADDGGVSDSDGGEDGDASASAGSRPATAGAVSASLGGDGTDDDSDLNSDTDSDALAVRTGVLDEKVAAAHALGAYAAAAGPAFAPYADAALAGLRRAARHFHDDLREAAYGAVGEVARAGAAAAGPPTAAGAAVPPAAAAVAAATLPLLSSAIERDPDAGAAAAAAAAAAEAVDALGAATAPHARALADAATAVLAGGARSQAVDPSSSGSDAGGAADGDDDDDAGEAEELLVGAAADLLPALARALGADAYAPTFAATHADALLGRLRASQPPDVRAAAAGALADVCLALGARAADAAARAAPSLVRELRSHAPVCRRNAAYAVGAAAGCAPDAYAPHARAALEALGALAAHNGRGPGAEADPGARDNAAGALARLALALPPGAVPVGAVVAGLLPLLRPEGPGLDGDPGEAEPVVRLLAAVAGAPPGTAGAAEPHAGRCAAALAAAAADGDAPAGVRVAAARGLAAAAAARPDMAAALVAALPEGVKAELEVLVAHGGGG